MPEKDTTFWATVGAGLAAIGSWLRYYIANKSKSLDWPFWRDGAIDVVGSVSLGIVVYLGATQFVSEIAAAGAGGLVGHLGARETIMLLRRFTEKK